MKVKVDFYIITDLVPHALPNMDPVDQAWSIPRPSYCDQRTWITLQWCRRALTRNGWRSNPRTDSVTISAVLRLKSDKFSIARIFDTAVFTGEIVEPTRFRPR